MAIYSDTWGFILSIKTGTDLSSATDLILRFKTPSGSVVDKVLDETNIAAPASKGVINYLIQDGDFPVGGAYTFQLFDVTTGRRLASNIGNLSVVQSLRA